MTQKLLIPYLDISSPILSSEVRDKYNANIVSFSLSDYEDRDKLKRFAASIQAYDISVGVYVNLEDAKSTKEIKNQTDSLSLLFSLSLDFDHVMGIIPEDFNSYKNARRWLQQVRSVLPDNTKLLVLYETEAEVLKAFTEDSEDIKAVDNIYHVSEWINYDA